MASDFPERLLTVNEASEALRVGPRTLRRRLEDGSVRGVRIGPAVRVPESEVRRILSSSLHLAASELERLASHGT
jgi:excisionase family DNA binding protein